MVKNIIFSARVAELADALDLGSSGETFRGSTPLSRTTSPSLLSWQPSLFCIPKPFPNEKQKIAIQRRISCPKKAK